MAGVTVHIGGDASKAISVLGNLQDKAASTAAKIADGFKTRVGQRLFDGLAQAAAALPNAIKAAADAGGRLADQMGRTGAAGEGLVVLERFLNNAGVGGDKMVSLLGLMQKAISGLNEEAKPTAAAFAEIGLSAAELRAKDPVEAFLTIGQAIMRIPDAAERAALAMRLFGRSGAEALAAFSDGAGFESARAELGSLPDTLAQNAGALDAVSDRLGNMGTAWQQLGVAVAVGILPAMEKITAALATVDLESVGQAVGALLSTLAAVAPYLIAIGAGMGALKIANFVMALNSKIRAWIAETAAIKANTAALRENAGAGAGVGKGGVGKGGMGMGAAGAAGGALVIAGIAAEYANRWMEQKAGEYAAFDEAVDRGNESVKKFNVELLKGQLASRGEIEKTRAAINDEIQALGEAADEQMKGLDDPAARDRVIQDTEVTVKILQLKSRALNKISEEQLAANAATRAAAEAEAQHAKAIEAAADAYKKSRAEYQQKIDAAGEKIDTSGTVSEQLAELARAEAAARGKMTKFGDRPDAAAMIHGLDYEDDSPAKTADLEQAVKIHEIEERRVDLAAKLADETARANQAKAAAVADWQEEMKIINAQLAGNQEKVKSLQKEAAIRAEIARLVGIGFTHDEAKSGATQLIAAKEAQQEAQQEADARAKKADAREKNRDVLADGAALAGGPAAMEKRNMEKRTMEIVKESGVSESEAKNMAANESSLEKLSGLRTQGANSQYESAVGAVSSMQRIGGGGGAVASGLDVARQQADLQRQMVQILGQMLSTQPTEPIVY